MQTDDRAQQVESASVNLESGMHFVGDIDGFRVDTDVDEGFGRAGVGPQPLHFLLFGVAGCTIEVVYRVRGKGLDPRAVEGAIELSETRYCPAIAMVGRAARIESWYEIEEVD